MKYRFMPLVRCDGLVFGNRPLITLSRIPNTANFFGDLDVEEIKDYIESDCGGHIP